VSALCSSMTSHDVADKKRGLKTLVDVELSMTGRAMSARPYLVGQARGLARQVNLGNRDVLGVRAGVGDGGERAEHVRARGEAPRAGSRRNHFAAQVAAQDQWEHGLVQASGVAFVYGQAREDDSVSVRGNTGTV